MKPIICLVLLTSLSIQFKFSSPYGLRYSRLAKTVRKRDNSEPENNLVDSEGRYIGGFNSDCTESNFLSPFRKTVRIEPDEEVLEKPRVRCHWNVFGTETCLPILDCKKFKLTPNSPNSEEPCPEEHLEVTDGSGGYQRFCGGDGPKNLTTSKDLRDLYLTFQGASSSKIKGRGFKCTVSCFEKAQLTPETSKSLEENYEPTRSEFCTCGRKPNGNRIVGGEDAKRGEFPWIVALVTANTRQPYCGGTVINNKFIMTAAHCFKGKYTQIKNFQILINARVLDTTSTEAAGGSGPLTPEQKAALEAKDDADLAIRFDVEKYFIHPLYVKQTNDFDVALIKLKEPIDFQKYSHIQPACLPELGSQNITYAGWNATVAGWGLNSSEALHTAATLQKLDVVVFNQSECKSFFDERISNRMMCAGFKKAGKDSCKGDSGGPLVAEKKSQVWQLIGTVSWGESCANSNSPGVYQRVPEVIQWVRYTSNLEDGVWCRE